MDRHNLMIIILSTVILSCSSLLDKKYNEETLVEDIKVFKESGELSDDDLELISGWILKSTMEEENLKEKTYEQILEEAKDYKNNQDKLEQKIKLEEELKRQKLGQTLTVAMYDKGYEEYDYQEYLTYSFAFENKSKKDIRAFKGSIVINDLFDSEIKSINLTIDDPIKAGDIHKGTYTTKYNQFMDEDTRLKSKGLNDLKIVWTPEKIIFEDGTSLE